MEEGIAMNLLGRTWRVIRANARDWQQRRADPEQQLARALTQLQEELACVRQAVARAAATQKRTERQAQNAERQASEWQQRARLALRKGDETQARAALARRQLSLETAATLQQTLARERGIVGKLKADLQVLEGQISAATLQKDLFFARAPLGYGFPATERVARRIPGSGKFARARGRARWRVGSNGRTCGGRRPRAPLSRH